MNVQGQQVTLPMEDGTQQTFMVVGSEIAKGSEETNAVLERWVWIKSVDDLVETDIVFIPSTPLLPVDQTLNLKLWYSARHAKEWARTGKHNR